MKLQRRKLIREGLKKFELREKWTREGEKKKQLNRLRCRRKLKQRLRK